MLVIFNMYFDHFTAGQWKEGKRHGSGELTSKDGKLKYSGVWVMGERVRDGDNSK